jgi:hypothetical protein
MVLIEARERKIGTLIKQSPCSGPAVSANSLRVCVEQCACAGLVCEITASTSSCLPPPRLSLDMVCASTASGTCSGSMTATLHDKIRSYGVKRGKNRPERRVSNPSSGQIVCLQLSGCVYERACLRACSWGPHVPNESSTCSVEAAKHSQSSATRMRCAKHNINMLSLSKLTQYVNASSGAWRTARTSAEATSPNFTSLSEPAQPPIIC